MALRLAQRDAGTRSLRLVRALFTPAAADTRVAARDDRRGDGA
jgi:hypothetical protein